MTKTTNKAISIEGKITLDGGVYVGPAVTRVDIDGITWLVDERNNRASIRARRSEEQARAMLASLKNCSDCWDCSDCSDCSGCSDCWGCSDCSRCSGCSRCSDCWDCSDCSRCSDCSGCSGCWDCSRCSDCWGCSGCSRCSDCWGCSGCSGCSRCSDCWGCSDCSRCSRCSDCSGLENCEPVKVERPAIPIIEGIHRKVYEAASQPDCLNMRDWHTCETTHCRAGWVVHLAGEAGRDLERRTSTLFAAMQIYKASGYEISPVRFFDGNEAALEDMKRLAELEDGAKAEA